jgi:uncharacterized protein
MLNYFKIIAETIRPDSLTYKIYMVHAVLVTNKALAIGRKLGLSDESLEFIEEAGMLHDIGVIKVESPKMEATGELPYIAHGVAGGELLRAREENQNGDLENHALVAERHVGVGLTAREIQARALPLPAVDFTPVSLEEQIITYADLFFSKREATLWLMETPEAIEAELAGFGAEQVEIFRSWRTKFGE